MKKLFKISISLIAILLSSCGNNNVSPSSKEEHVHQFDDIYVLHDADRKTYIKGSDFDKTGLKVAHKCKTCNEIVEVEFGLENDTDLDLEQTSVTIKAEEQTIDYPIVVKEKYRIACCGDSLTAGHMWPNQAYPVYLRQDVSENYEVGNFSYNGLSITGYGGSFDDPNQRYILRDEYKQSLAYEPDIFAIMLGTNDATGWANAKDIFYDEYCVLLDSYIEAFPNAKFIMMVSPPVIDNTFGIPNDIIKENVNPIQRDLADEYGFEVLDLREEFEDVEDYVSKYLRPNDGVHFTVEGAQYVASRVWDIAKDLTL